MVVHCGRSMERHAVCARDRLRLDVQIVQKLDVIRDEPDGHHDRVALAVRGEPRQYLGDVGLEPRPLRGASPALKGERPARVTEASTEGLARSTQLAAVRCSCYL